MSGRRILILLLCVIAQRLPAQHRALLEPADGRVYHGAQTMTFAPAGDPLAGYLGMLADSTIQPAVRGLFFSIPGTRGPAKSLGELGNFFAAADSIGFIPELSLFFVSTTATDSAIAMTTQYDAVLDSIVTLSKAYGKRMFLRLGGEFNGAGPGWNGGGYHPHLYVTAFRKIVDRYAARGFRDSIATIWCYYPAAANDFDSVDARGALWYPGDAYVDWFGLDLFDPQDFDLALPDQVRGVITRKGKSERFLSMARAKGKPVMMSETSAKGMNLSADPADGAADWSAWFAKFWAFIAAHTEIKGYSYIDANWPAGAYPGWGDARIGNSPYVTGRYRAELRNPKYIHLPVRRATGASAAPLLPRTIALHPNYPHPLLPASAGGNGTTIAWAQTETAAVTVIVRDVRGTPVRTLRPGMLAAGDHAAVWDGRNENGLRVAPGMYLLQLLAGAESASRSMLVIE
jgi:hypothetical protein